MKVSVIRWFIYLLFIISQYSLASEDAPEMALLEFLGSFESDDKQWFDPTLLVEVEIFDEGLDKGQSNEKNEASK